jgi:hypothetical protein
MKTTTSELRRKAFEGSPAGILVKYIELIILGYIVLSIMSNFLLVPTEKATPESLIILKKLKTFFLFFGIGIMILFGSFLPTHLILSRLFHPSQQAIRRYRQRRIVAISESIEHAERSIKRKEQEIKEYKEESELLQTL